jgi:serine/threonine protein kinase
VWPANINNNTMAQQGRNEGSAAEEEEDIFSEGDVIDEKYKIVKRLGKGGYGEIYSARHIRTGDSVAVKVERLSKPGNLLEEERILRNLKGCKYVPRLLSTGRHKDQVNYMIMDLYADNLSSLRRKQPDHRFSLTTTALLAIQTIRSVKEVHDRGYLHRDIKPGNFVLGTKRTGNPRTVIIIDFGLSRRHFRPDGGVRPKRKAARWVGSRRYMSINTH